MNNGLAASSIGTATTGDWLNATNLLVIAIGIVLALLVIVWGARLKRQRKAVDQAIEDRADEAHAAPTPTPAPMSRVTALDDATPAAPETDPVPVAPSPPPLADIPVVAAAALDASPATLATDLATPPTATPSPVEESGGADDLTTLKGVGPKLAARLGELGYTRFEEIARLSPADAATLDAQLGSFQGRMARDRWIEQAGYLAKGDRAGFETAFGKL